MAHAIGKTSLKGVYTDRSKGKVGNIRRDKPLPNTTRIVTKSSGKGS